MLTSEASWPSVEGRIAGLISEFASAHDLDGWQDVGRRSREILIDAVNLVYDESMCPDGEPVPKRSDAKGRLDQILKTRLAGSSYEQLRGWFRQSWALANTTTHAATAPKTAAFASGQSAVALARALQLLAQETAPRPVAVDEPPTAVPDELLAMDEPPF